MAGGEDFDSLEKGLPLLKSTSLISSSGSHFKKASAFFALTLFLSTVIVGSYSLFEYSGSIPFSEARPIDIEKSNKEDIGRASLKHLIPYLESQSNTIVSPACQALVNGLVLTESDEASSFGRESGFNEQTVKEDTLALLKGLNWRSQPGKIRAGLLQQQIGTKMHVDRKKALGLLDNAFFFEDSHWENCQENAEDLFSRQIGTSSLDFKIPPQEQDTLLTYSAIALKDEFTGDFQYFVDDFKTSQGSKKVSYIHTKRSALYYESEFFQATVEKLNQTELLFILPKKGIEINNLNILSCIEETLSNGEMTMVSSRFPCFYVKTKICDEQERQPNDDKFFNKIVETSDGLDTIFSLQTASFQIGRDGIYGGQVYTSSSLKDSVLPSGNWDFDCSSPFYCLCLYDDFPIFLSKIVDPSVF